MIDVYPPHIIEVYLAPRPRLPDWLAARVDAMSEEEVLDMIGADSPAPARRRAPIIPRRPRVDDDRIERAGTADTNDSRYLIELYKDAIDLFNRSRVDADNPRLPDDLRQESRAQAERLVDGIARLELLFEHRDDVERIERQDVDEPLHPAFASALARIEKSRMGIR